MTPNHLGALFMMASMAFFTLNDMLMKVTGGDVPLFQMLFLRGVLTTLLIIALARWLGTLTLNFPKRDWIYIGLRSGAEMAASYFIVTALFHLPLANVTAILQVLPLTVTIGGVLFFKETVGWQRMLAILVGFIGMLLIVRPGPDGFNVFTAYALMGVLCVTIRDLATRQLSKQAPSLVVTLSSAVAVMVFSGAASLTTPWLGVSSLNAVMIALSSFCIFGGYYFSVRVMRTGDISFIAPFRYTGLIWALILGWLVFGDWPTNLTMIGAVIVVGTGLFTLYRERAVKQG
jgi:S-adenosylmethionine uptake transporter